MANIGYCIYNSSMRSYTFDQHFSFLNSRHTLNVFHIDKLTTDRAKTTPTNEDKFNIIDISYKTSREIARIILDLKIDVFIFYTFQSVLDKYIWRICRYLSIPTIFHDHGIVFGDKIVGEQKINLSIIRIKRKLSFIIKNIQLNNISDENFPKKPIIGNYIFDHFILFSHNNYEYYNFFFKINENNCTLTGIPLFLDENELTLLKKISPERKILYIHQPLRKLGFSSISFNEEIKFIKSINDISHRLNFKLEVRLHPSQSHEEYTKHLLISGINFDNKTNLQIQAAKATIILGHWSTALSIAYPLEKPLIILEYPKVSQKYFSFFSIFKEVGMYCSNINQLERTLKIIQNDYKADDEKWRHLIGKNNTLLFDILKLNSIIEKITSNDKKDY